MAERADVVFIHLMRFVVSAGTRGELHFEAAALIDGVVKFSKRVGDFHACDVQLEAVDKTRIVRLQLRQGRDLDRKLVDDRGLDQRWLYSLLEGRYQSMSAKRIVAHGLTHGLT